MSKNMLASYSIADTYGIKHDSIIQQLHNFKNEYSQQYFKVMLHYDMTSV